MRPVYRAEGPDRLLRDARMDNDEATAVLGAELAALRDEEYAELVRRTSAGPLVFERTAPSGRTYQVEVYISWDDRHGGNVRVMASIDDGGWRALVPLTRDFVKAPNGSFVGE